MRLDLKLRRSINTLLRRIKPGGKMMENKLTFNENPEAYHKYRPAYPEQLMEDIISFSGIKESGNIIEVGCGTGKATELFTKRNFNITGIELGKNLAEFAARFFNENSNVKIINSSFEDWNPQGEKFDLLISAQAFHWIDPKVKYLKAVSVLKENGSMGLFWNMYDENKSDFLKEFDNIYKTLNPTTNEGEKGKHEVWIEDMLQEIKETNMFNNINEKTYKWQTQYNEEHLVNLLNTYSDIHMWEEPIKEN